MKRLFSIRRRRPHVVDVWINRIDGVNGFSLKWGANFSSAPATIITCTNMGFFDQNVNRQLVDAQPLGDQVRVVFDPATYSIPDDLTFWLQCVPLTNGIEGTPGAMTLVLPSDVRNGSLVTIAGTPTGTQQLDLPTLIDIKIQNAGPITMHTESGGDPFTVPGSATDTHSLGFLGAQSTLYVSGGAFSLAGTLALGAILSDPVIVPGAGGGGGGGGGGVGGQYPDGALRGSATGTLLMVDDGVNIQSASGDTAGRLNVNAVSTSDTAISTSVAAGITSTPLLGSNASRRGATIYNDSSSDMYVMLGAAASSTSFTARLVANGYYEVPYGYLGPVNGIWMSATGSARITELTSTGASLPEPDVVPENIDLYVSVTGDDATGDGTQASPYQTLARAKTRISTYAALDQVRIYITAAGSYPAVSWDGTRFVGNKVRPGRLAIIALESTRVVHVTGTVLAGSTVFSLNTSDLGADNSQRGRFVVRRDSAGVVLDERLITANTASTIRPSTGFTSVPTATDTFEIVLPGVYLTGSYTLSNFDGGNAHSPNLRLSDTEVAGCFLLNLKTDYFGVAKSFLYLKEIELSASASGIFGDNAVTMVGWVSSYPTYYGVRYLSFLGAAPHDGVWFGAGLSVMNGFNLISPDSGITDGFFVTRWIWNTGNQRGTLRFRGGAICARDSDNIRAVDCSGSPGGEVIFTYVTDTVNGANTLVPTLIECRGVGLQFYGAGWRLYVSNVILKTGLEGVRLYRGATALFENTNVTSFTGTAATYGIWVESGGKAIFYGPPAITGTLGDTVIVDAGASVVQPNSYYSTNVVHGLSVLGSQICRLG